MAQVTKVWVQFFLQNRKAATAWQKRCSTIKSTWNEKSNLQKVQMLQENYKSKRILSCYAQASKTAAANASQNRHQNTETYEPNDGNAKTWKIHIHH